MLNLMSKVSDIEQRLRYKTNLKYSIGILHSSYKPYAHLRSISRYLIIDIESGVPRDPPQRSAEPGSWA